MSYVIPEDRNLHAKLSEDMFQHFILPDLLSQHLHALLIDPDPPQWHAFYVLPLVSRLWYHTCQSLFSSIFGIKRPSDERSIQDVEDPEDFDFSADSGDSDPSATLDYAISMWKRTRYPASRTIYSHHHNRSTLMADRSLVRAYTCLALGIMFLNDNVLLPLGAYSSDARDNAPMGRARRSAWDEDYAEEIQGQHERADLDEGSIHRCLMPFECAQRICDFVLPKRLAYTAAEYMGQVLPEYNSLPLLTKYTKDLQFSIERDYVFDLETQEDYIGYASRSLGRLENIEELLEKTMSFGVLVRSFWDESGVPSKALKLTGTICALDDVVRADWGADTINVRRRASALIRRWTVFT